MLLDQVASAHKWDKAIVRGDIVMASLATVSIAIRFVAKYQTKAKFGVDDAFIIAAQILCYIQVCMHIYAEHLAKHLVSMFEPGYTQYVMWSCISGMLYAPTVLCISVSVLTFYRRIFPIQSMKRIIWAFLAVHVLWFFAAFFGQLFICSPVEFAWAPVMVQAKNPEKCMKYPLFFVSIFSIELGLNAAVLALPIKQAFGLKLSLQTRLMLIFVFLLGGASIISGIVRIQQTYRPGEPYINLAADMFWLSVHLNTALIAASLPIYRPLLRATVGLMSNNIRKIYGSGYDSRRSGISSGNKTSLFDSNKSAQKSPIGPAHMEKDSYHRWASLDDIEAQPNHIRVERDFEVL